MKGKSMRSTTIIHEEGLRDASPDTIGAAAQWSGHEEKLGSISERKEDAPSASSHQLPQPGFSYL